MPIYEYYCASCKREFELMRPITQHDSPARCPSCGVDAQKLVSAAASKIDYSLKAPTKPAFRQHQPAEEDKTRAETS